MVYRNSWLAGIAGIAFALVQLNDLVLPTAGGVAWQYIVIAALALGVIISWTALTYRLKTWVVVITNAAAALIAIVRVATPETTRFLMPTATSLDELSERLTEAQRLIRTGVEPVVPDAGVVVVLMLVLWAVGGLLSWGLLRGHPYVALLPPLVLSLQFATMDRQPTGALTIGAFIALVALVIFAITADDRDHTSGRMAPRGQWASTRNRPGPAAAGLLSLTVLGSVFVVGAAAGSIPRDGVLSWRVDSGGLPANAYGSSLSYNPFISIQKRLVTNSNTRAFLATIASDVPLDEVYFRFMTLDEYDGVQFSVGSPDLLDFDADTWENPGHSFTGPTEPLTTIVGIDRLVMNWLPTPSTPFAVESIDDGFDQYLSIRPEDAAVYYPNGSKRGMLYRVDANVPVPDLDALATNQATGELSIAFKTAIADGSLPVSRAPQPTVAAVQRPAPPDEAKFLDLPADPAARTTEIRALAALQTEGLETPFEMGLALETYLRGFTYSLEVPEGHAAADLAAWLLDPESDGYQTGYCENFSTAMAVMARTLGIHSRVVLGFTPGQRDFREENQVVVRDRNAHAWVELWMPSQGWVRFDPTPRGDEVNPSTAGLLEDTLDADIRDFLDIEIPDVPEDGGGTFTQFEEFPPSTLFIGQSGGDQAAGGGISLPAWFGWVVPVIGLIVLVALGIPLAKRWRHNRRMRRLRNGDISAAWKDIVFRLDDLGRPVRPTDTPTEVADSVNEAMAPLAAAYARSVYGRADAVPSPIEIETVETSLLTTRDLITASATRGRRLKGTYIPPAVKRRKRRRNGGKRNESR